jgi:hypothetical protein
MASGKGYNEAGAQLVLVGFLQRIVNGGGSVECEVGVGRGRVDVLVRKPYTAADATSAEQHEAVEIKVRYPGRPDPLAEGLAQLDRYLDRLRSTPVPWPSSTAGPPQHPSPNAPPSASCNPPADGRSACSAPDTRRGPASRPAGTVIGMGHRVLHLSDTHLTASGYDADGVHAVASLKQILFDARHLDGIDLVLVSGDVADDGSAGGCQLAREIIGDFAVGRGIPHVYAMGNHDDRAAFAQVLGTGHRAADGADAGRDWAGGAERAAVSEVGGLRVITLDSHEGMICRDQLRWLAGLLADPAPRGSLLAFHHPPVHVPTSAFVSSAGLRNADELADAVAGSDVQAILCGHYHVQLTGHLRGVPVWVTPGVVTRIDLTAPRHLVRAVKGASATVVELGGPFSPAFHVLHARDPEVGRQAYLVDALSWQPVLAEDAG